MDDSRRRQRQGHIYLLIDGKRVAEHRLVVEAKLGRSLAPHEVVHHIDGDPLNNHPDNLMVMSRGEHMVLHLREMPLVPWMDEELERAIQLKRKGLRIDDIATALEKS